MEESVQALVVDNGAYFCKAGFSGDDAPRGVFRSLVGRPVKPEVIIGKEQLDVYVGNQISGYEEVLNLQNPIERAEISNWEDMERLWHYCFFSELKVAPDEHPILLTTGPGRNKALRENMTQVMFETFNVPAFYVGIQQALALYASGRTTGIIADCGYEFISAVPIYEGFVLPHAVIKSKIGGKDLDNHLLNLLAGRGYQVADPSFITAIKESLCYVAVDYKQELEKTSEVPEEPYSLPDGSVLKLKEEKFNCPELLFQPSIGNYNQVGLSECVNRAIQKCNNSIRKDLYGNVVFCGGTTLFPGIAERLTKEISPKANSQVTVDSPSERKYSVWIGGSILTSLSSFQQMWVSKAEYDESGPEIVHRKCF